MKRLTINIPDDRGNLYELIRYPAGEIQVRLTPAGVEAANKAEEYIISANPIPDIIELAQLKNALDGMNTIEHTWYRKTLELMYLPYARADRRFQDGDSFGLAVFAKLINALNFTIVYTFDVHSLMAGILIRNLINLDPVYAYDQISPIIEDIGPGLVLIAPDKGAESRYDLQTFKRDSLVASKTRDPKTGALSGFSIPRSIKSYRKGLIIDDICDGGGTFIGLAEEIHRINPKMKLYLYVSHGIFSKGLTELNKHFANVYVSDFSFKTPEMRGWVKV